MKMPLSTYFTHILKPNITVVSSKCRKTVSCIPFGASRHLQTKAAGLQPFPCLSLPSRFLHFTIRNVRTGFFKEDLDYLDPKIPMFAEPEDQYPAPDNRALRNSVIERNNVGMGLLLLTPEWMNLTTINQLYRKLRDLEVNTLKRFVVVASSVHQRFPSGRPRMDLLKLLEMSYNDGSTDVAMKYLRNQYELSFILRNFYKPLVLHVNGRAEESSAALVSMANYSAAYKNASFSCNHTALGWFPDAGLSYVLSQLERGLGLYLALTGNDLCGSDLLWSGICKYWMSPEAIPFMERTSEKTLEVSEKDSKLLLHEHFLDPPESEWLESFAVAIEDHFSYQEFDKIIAKLDTTRKSRDPLISSWAEKCLLNIKKHRCTCIAS